MRAAAIIADVRFPDYGGNAIGVSVGHAEGQVMRDLLPYVRRRKAVIYGPRSAPAPAAANLVPFHSSAWPLPLFIPFAYSHKPVNQVVEVPYCSRLHSLGRLRSRGTHGAGPPRICPKWTGSN
jgi:hypothetical protein